MLIVQLFLHYKFLDHRNSINLLESVSQKKFEKNVRKKLTLPALATWMNSPRVTDREASHTFQRGEARISAIGARARAKCMHTSAYIYTGVQSTRLAEREMTSDRGRTGENANSERTRREEGSGSLAPQIGLTCWTTSWPEVERARICIILHARKATKASFFSDTLSRRAMFIRLRKESAQVGNLGRLGTGRRD